MFGEASTEIGLNALHEVCLNTLAALPQHVRVEVDTGRNIYRSVVDGLRYRGRWELVDAKHDWQGFKTERGRLQVELAGIAAEALNCGYEQVVRDSIGDSAFRHNLTVVEGSRFVEPTQDQIVRTQEIMASRLEMARGSLADVIAPGNRPYGLAVISAMMVRRLVAIELHDGKIDDDTRVSSAPRVTAVEPFLPVASDA